VSRVWCQNSQNAICLSVTLVFSQSMPRRARRATSTERGNASTAVVAAQRTPPTAGAIEAAVNAVSSAQQHLAELVQANGGIKGNVDGSLFARTGDAGNNTRDMLQLLLMQQLKQTMAAQPAPPAPPPLSPAAKALAAFNAALGFEEKRVASAMLVQTRILETLQFVLQDPHTSDELKQRAMELTALQGQRALEFSQSAAWSWPWRLFMVGVVCQTLINVAAMIYGWSTVRSAWPR
jgi:hypothetical protein